MRVTTIGVYLNNGVSPREWYYILGVTRTMALHENLPFRIPVLSLFLFSCVEARIIHIER